MYYRYWADTTPAGSVTKEFISSFRAMPQQGISTYGFQVCISCSCQASAHVVYIALNPASLCGARQGIDSNPALPCNPGWDDLANHQNEVCRATRFKDRKSSNLTTHARWESCRPGKSDPRPMHLKKTRIRKGRRRHKVKKRHCPFLILLLVF